MFIDMNRLDYSVDIRARITEDRMVISFGDYAFMSLTEIEVEQLQYEINAALMVERDKQAAWLEADAHDADGTLLDMVHGGNAGGRQ